MTFPPEPDPFATRQTLLLRIRPDAANDSIHGLELWSIGSNQPALPGDFDGDSDVDGADFVAWQTNFPKTSGGTRATGDGDGDGDVDGADFVVWQTHFPTQPSAGGAEQQNTAPAVTAGSSPAAPDAQAAEKGSSGRQTGSSNVAFPPAGKSPNQRPGAPAAVSFTSVPLASAPAGEPDPALTSSSGAGLDNAQPAQPTATATDGTSLAQSKKLVPRGTTARAPATALPRNIPSANNGIVRAWVVSYGSMTGSGSSTVEMKSNHTSTEAVEASEGPRLKPATVDRYLEQSVVHRSRALGHAAIVESDDYFYTNRRATPSSPALPAVGIGARFRS